MKRDHLQREHAPHQQTSDPSLLLGSMSTQVNHRSFFDSLPWQFTAPPQSHLGDHDVLGESNKLLGRSVALMVCGGIAAMKAPMIARSLRKAGAVVRVFASQEALKYVTEDTLAWSSNQEVITSLSARAEHLGDGATFDAYLIAPATYNTINKFSLGIADNLITATLASALGKSERQECEILIAPTMHGSMHNSILTDSLTRLRGLGVHMIKPREAYGKHNIPSEAHIVNEVSRAISRSPLKGKGILITGGPTPVKIDDVRRLTNKFTGRLSIAILEELHARGAEARLLLGIGSHMPPEELTPFVEWTHDYEGYLHRVCELANDPLCYAGIFSAAVADYQPDSFTTGKIESGQTALQISLKPTIKVIDEVKRQAPHLKMVTFKYQEGISHDQLMEIAERRLDRFDAVFANRGEERGPRGEQVGWLCKRGAEAVKITGKRSIAAKIADYLETEATLQAARQGDE